ncbi:hypothetical protein NC651_019154 [Populus alba x Populus x berolinensis]|nr:hypothetical protein NC651_019136 [Populus alba x Populus x berolinensis]KAJ6901305.1 hypothetical protein NC651_019154 [Populus alba x Populus x berolinensis]
MILHMESPLCPTYQSIQLQLYLTAFKILVKLHCNLTRSKIVGAGIEQLLFASLPAEFSNEGASAATPLQWKLAEALPLVAGETRCQSSFFDFHREIDNALGLNTCMNTTNLRGEEKVVFTLHNASAWTSTVKFPA